MLGWGSKGSARVSSKEAHTLRVTQAQDGSLDSESGPCQGDKM